MAALGDLGGARDTGAEAVTLLEQEGETYDAPEILRIKAKYLMVGGIQDEGEAEALLLHAIAIARRQCATFWEIRFATDLATLWGK